MNWVIFSGLMFISSIIYYIIMKLSVNKKISREGSMIANFFIAGIFFLIINILKGYSIFIPFKILAWIFTASLLFSYVGGAAGYEAIRHAPNAGYSLIIQKSYAVYTSLIAIYLFKASFSIVKFIAVLIIITCTGIISISRGKKINKQNYYWVFLSLICFFCFGTLSLSNKYVVSQGIPSSVLLFWTMMFVTTFTVIGLILSKKNISKDLKKDRLLILFLTGFSVTFFYYFKQIAEISAPNIGYVNAINTASNAFYTVLVALIFKDQLSWKKFLAVVGVIFGLIILII